MCFHGFWELSCITSLPNFVAAAIPQGVTKVAEWTPIFNYFLCELLCPPSTSASNRMQNIDSMHMQMKATEPTVISWSYVLVQIWTVACFVVYETAMSKLGRIWSARATPCGKSFGDYLRPNRRGGQPGHKEPSCFVFRGLDLKFARRSESTRSPADWCPGHELITDIWDAAVSVNNYPRSTDFGQRNALRWPGKWC